MSNEHMNCATDPKCKTRAEMRKAHGTPSEFRSALTWAIGEISVGEYLSAIALYEREYVAAPEDEAGK